MISTPASPGPCGSYRSLPSPASFLLGGGYGQTYSYWGLNEYGDSVLHTFPPDSVYDHDRLILKFQKGALNNNLLCFDCEMSYGNKGGVTQTIDPACLAEKLGQQFPVDSGIILDPAVVAVLKSYGATHLKRMTFANPCEDTLSVTRLGDTIPMDHFNWMVCYFNNDTSIVPCLFQLNWLYAHKVALADIVVKSHLTRIPCDKEFSRVTDPQRGMKNIGMEIAWDYEVGNPDIRIAIIDDGLDYRRCEFGSIVPKPPEGQGNGPQPGLKVMGGYNYTNNSDNTLYNLSSHGTSVASIAAAKTHNKYCNVPTNEEIRGVVGIAGGWASPSMSAPCNATDEGFGCSLIGFKVTKVADNAEIDLPHSNSAILAAAAGGKSYGLAAHVINASYAGTTPSIAQKLALFEAARNGVVFVASSDNIGSNVVSYPAGYSPQSLAIATGGAIGFVQGDPTRNKTRVGYSNYGLMLDLLAPGGDNGVDVNLTVQEGNDAVFKTFAGTSAASPHVTGAVGLLRSWYLEREQGNYLEPEDYEGMLKATAEDQTLSGQTPEYLTNFDVQSGWGHLQVDKVFQRIDPDNSTDGKYGVIHWEITANDDNSTRGDWSATKLRIFHNSGYPGSIGDQDGNGHYFNAKVSKISMNFTIPENAFDFSKPIYVWPKSRGDHHCLSPEDPNFQNPFTDVTSGTGGNNLTRGIIHSHSRTVSLEGYQYEIFKNVNGTLESLGFFPPDDKLGFNFSVFGANPNYSASVIEKSYKGTPDEIQLLYRNGSYTLSINSIDPIAEVNIFDIMGRVIFGRAFAGHELAIELQLPVLPSGTYFCNVNSGGTPKIKSFIITR